MNEFNTQLALRTNKGDVDVKGTMNRHDVYSAKATLTNVDAGYLLKQDTMMGKITMNATVDGAGLDMKTANVHYDVNLVSAQVKGYEYKDLSLTGDVK